jgi:putative transposase
MSRLPRIEFPGALWHVTSRGVEKRNIFLDNRDRHEFIGLLGATIEQHGWCLYAYVLMSNHYHLLLKTPETNLSHGMQRLGGIYAERFNRRYARWGHLFGARFKSHLVETDSHLLGAARYIVLNPVRACITATADEWPWSSYLATACLKRAPRWLDIDSILEQFHPSDRERAAASYREFVRAGAEVGVRPLYGT